MDGRHLELQYQAPTTLNIGKGFKGKLFWAYQINPRSFWADQIYPD